MNEAKLQEYHDRLIAMLDVLEHEEELGQEGKKTVELDQQAVGRVSRGDALQQQSMAKATAQRRANQRLRIKAALGRVTEGEFGFCTECGEDIARRRLDLDPSHPTCVSCASGG